MTNTPTALPTVGPNLDPLQELNLNAGQQKAYEALLKFLTEPDRTMFVLQGYAGTGKTYLARKLCQDMHKYIDNFIFTAPTNKATKILSKTLKPWGANCRTIYSTLQIYLKGEENIQKLVFPDFPPKLKFTAIFIDEASMLTTQLLDYIAENYPSMKLVFIGDPAQLPPVGEDCSPVWAITCEQLRLTEVMRHDNQILAFATHLRACIEDDEHLVLAPNNDGKEGVFRLRRHKFVERIERLAALGKFRVADHTKVIAWRNKAVDYYNSLIRETVFGPSSNEEWLVGDWVMMAEPVMVGKTPIATIDDEGVILSREIIEHPQYPQYQCYNLVLSLSEHDGMTLNIQVLHEDSAEQFKDDLNDIADAAKQKGQHNLWRTFWDRREAFHRIRYAYAITAHRSQGSTYTNCIVDALDILSNRNKEEALRCLYVASTRASTRLALN